jgi:hypothetical protein
MVDHQLLLKETKMAYAFIIIDIDSFLLWIINDDFSPAKIA